ncbi:MAG: TlpA disulfide reductase family protein [Nitrospiraceae bacterium]|nr:TlpA disulfide reductase family protein [Nitrospiraceae bacterium]
MKAPDFTLKSMDGKTKEFADIKGQKLTVLLFWSTWSAYSQDALKQMEQMYDMYRSKGLSVMAIDVDGQETTDQTLSQIKSEISGMKLDLPVSIDYGLVMYHDYGVIAVPSTVILDKNRVIKYELAGFPLMGSADMADYIDSVFKSGPRQP